MVEDFLHQNFTIEMAEQMALHHILLTKLNDLRERDRL